MSQTNNLLSILPDARCWLSGAHAREVQLLLCPCNSFGFSYDVEVMLKLPQNVLLVVCLEIFTLKPSQTSYILITFSSATASLAPSGEDAMALTLFLSSKVTPVSVIEWPPMS